MEVEFQKALFVSDMEIDVHLGLKKRKKQEWIVICCLLLQKAAQKVFIFCVLNP